MNKEQFEALLWFIAEQLELQDCRESLSSGYFHNKSKENKEAAVSMAFPEQDKSND